MSGIVLSDPYPCDNPVASCARAPELKEINRQLGCIALNSETCMPLACPQFPCGDVCPTACAEDANESACQLYFSNLKIEDYVHSCEDFYSGMMKRALAQTPMKGCTGACEGDATGASQCCTITAGGPYTYRSGPNFSAFDAAQDLNPWSLGTDQNTLRDPQATVQNFLNQFSFCQSRTCGCPSVADKTGFRNICSGNGQCQLEFGTTFSGIACDPTDPANNNACTLIDPTYSCSGTGRCVTGAVLSSTVCDPTEPADDNACSKIDTTSACLSVSLSAPCADS